MVLNDTSLGIGVKLEDTSMAAVRAYKKILGELEDVVRPKGFDTLFATVDSFRNKRWTEFFGFRELEPGLMVKDI